MREMQKPAQGLQSWSVVEPRFLLRLFIPVAPAVCADSVAPNTERGWNPSLPVVTLGLLLWGKNFSPGLGDADFYIQERINKIKWP